MKGGGDKDKYMKEYEMFGIDYIVNNPDPTKLP